MATELFLVKETNDPDKSGEVKTERDRGIHIQIGTWHFIFGVAKEAGA